MKHFPRGLDLSVLSVDSNDITSDDYLLWYQPQLPEVAAVESALDRFMPGNRAILCYENPVAYDYRRWLLQSTFYKQFSQFFSCVSVLADSERHFWVPAWNYAIDFITGQPVVSFVERAQEDRKFLAINPMRNGVGVSSERLEIIDTFYTHARQSDIYGDTALYSQPPLNSWQSRFIGEIPFTTHPYIYSNKISVFSQYKFTLVIENVFSDWYITEKLAEPLAALSVPVYFGNPRIAEYMPKLFQNGVINGHDFPDRVALVRFLEGMTNDEYQARLECIAANRREYFDLTDHRRIWEYVLARIFGLRTVVEGSVIEAINLTMSTRNRAPSHREERQKLESLVHSDLTPTDYNHAMRDLLWHQADRDQLRPERQEEKIE